MKTRDALTPAHAGRAAGGLRLQLDRRLFAAAGAGGAAGGAAGAAAGGGRQRPARAGARGVELWRQQRAGRSDRDDRRHGGGAIPAILMEGGRNGSWWAGGDTVSPGASIDPNGDASSEVIPGGGRCGSLHAMHVTGQGFTSWAQRERLDALRLGRRGGLGTAPLRRAHPHRGHLLGPDWRHLGRTRFACRSATSTRARKGAFATPRRRPAPAPPATTPSGSTSCRSARPGPSTGSRSRGWDSAISGCRRSRGSIPAAIYTIEFDFYPNEIFDFWVDDISFY